MSEKLFALKNTVPILLGYLAIGLAFGLIVQNAGYPWFIVALMSVIVFAGAGQYVMVGMFSAGATMFDIAATIFLINSRHMVYGLSLLDKFKGTGIVKPYLIFGLTDETYALLTTVKVPEEMNKTKVYGYITFFDHLYWISGSIIGFFAGAWIPFDFAGVDFALTALFVVLLVEQWKNCAVKLPFLIALICALLAIAVVGAKSMLIAAFIMSIISLIIFRGRIESADR